MQVKQVWKCPSCGREVKAPLPYKAVACDNTHNGKYTEVQMRLVEGELPKERTKRRG